MERQCRVGGGGLYKRRRRAEGRAKVTRAGVGGGAPTGQVIHALLLSVRSQYNIKVTFMRIIES
jgi:hypothetical protein